MKKIHLILIFNVIFISSGFSQNYALENAYWECYVKTAHENGINLEKEFADFENYLIKNEILPDASGESYFNLFEQIASGKIVELNCDYSFIDTLRLHADNTKISGITPDCQIELLNQLGTLDFMQSKMYQIENICKSLESSGDFSISKIAKKLCETLSPVDFEQNYYKFSVLFAFFNVLTVDNSIDVNLPLISDENPMGNLNIRNIVLVYVSTDNDSVLVNNKKVKIENVSKIIQEYIFSNPNDTLMPEMETVNIILIGNCEQSKLVISFQNDREAKYQTYIKVQDQIIDAYNFVRNDKAIEYFKKEFDLLNENQQKAIIELIPCRISEAEPK